MVGHRSDMGPLRWGGKLGEAVGCLTGGLGSASAAERPALAACASASRRGASVASSRSRPAAGDAPVVLVGWASMIRRMKSEKRPSRACMGAMGVAGLAPRAASA